MPIQASTVVLLRERGPGEEVEVFLVRRHRKSSFMSDAFVFPGGRIDDDDTSPELGALRELFEEAGVLLARGRPLADDERIEWRRRLNSGEARFSELIATGVEPDLARLHYWARWVTPSVEPKRFDVRFYVAECPSDQTPSFDRKETTEERWITPSAALATHARGDGSDLKLPPPQVRTLFELAPHARDLAAVRRASAERREHPHPVMPRFAQLDDAMALLLPWDPDYETRGVGERTPMPHEHFLATGPSRFVLDGMSWRLTAPGSP